MSVIRAMCSQIEQYSIDECFILLPETEDYAAFGRHLSQIVERWTGHPRQRLELPRPRRWPNLQVALPKSTKDTKAVASSIHPKNENARWNSPTYAMCGVSGEKVRQSSSRWASTPHGNSPDQDGNKSSCSWALRVKKLGANSTASIF